MHESFDSINFKWYNSQVFFHSTFLCTCDIWHNILLVVLIGSLSAFWLCDVCVWCVGEEGGWEVEEEEEVIGGDVEGKEIPMEQDSLPQVA